MPHAFAFPLLAMPMTMVMALHVNANAAINQAMPPPGLYQIDMDVNAMHAGGNNHQAKTNGATGAEQHRFSSPSGAATVNAVGPGPATQCIKPYTANAGVVAATTMPAGQCSKQSSKVIDDRTVVHTAQCSTGNMTVTYKKIDDKTWQMETRHEIFAPQGPAAYGSVLQMQAALGTTPAARAQARQQLATMPAMTEQAKKKRAEDLAQLKAALQETSDPEMRATFQKGIDDLSQQGQQPGKVVQTVVATTRLTRISDTCDAPKPSH
jgi:hypothetical protein